jgi:hypothetical protein
MTDTPITNCYISTRELALAYFAGDPRAAAFIATPANMDWYLKRATKAIDAMQLAGLTYYIYNRNTTIDTDEQSLAFPRVINGLVHEWNDDTGLPIVPQNVKDACCEEALALYDFYADDDAQERYDRQEQGVSSASNPSGSESYQAGTIAKRRGLHSVAAYDRMKVYLAGAVELSFGGVAYTPDILTSVR